MSDSARTQLRALVAQIAALKEQATAIGMQAATLEQSLQAALLSLPTEPVEIRATASNRVAYFGPPVEHASTK